MYYYIYKICNYCLDIYYNCKSKIFFIQDIKTNNENKKITLLKLYFFYYFNFLLNYIPIRTRLYLQNTFNNYDNNRLIKIQFSNGKINRNIIYKNISSYNLSKNIKTNYSDENLFNENEIMMMKKKIVLDIFYKDNANNKTSIKNLIENYADKNKKYNDNKIKNILLLENIDKNKIYLTYLQGIRRQEKEYNLEEIDYHVSDIYDF
jgi:hypothetical protein